jgi:alpha-galactosidase
MPFSIVRSSSRERFSEVLINLAYIESIEPERESPAEVKILRGLFYVHLYAALEKAVNETIEQVILLIKSDAVQNKHFSTPFNVISLDAKMQSFKQCGYKDYFKKSSEVFNSIDSVQCFEISNTIFSQNLQNVWYKTMLEIIASFGANEIQITPRVRLTIDEIVEKRNAVAHGRETPLVVGERHRCSVLRIKTQEIQLIVEQFISTFEDYITNKGYLKPEHIHHY